MQEQEQVDQQNTPQSDQNVLDQSQNQSIQSESKLSFKNQLWNRFDLIRIHSQERRKMTEDYLEVIQELGKIEENHSSKLQWVVQKLDKISSIRGNHIWATAILHMKDYYEKQKQESGEMAVIIKEKIHLEIQSQVKNQNTVAKLLLGDGKQTQENLQEKINDIERYEIKYKQKKKEYEEQALYFEIFSQLKHYSEDKKSKQEQKLQQFRKECRDIQNKYEQSIQNYNDYLSQYYQRLGTIFEKMEQQEDQRCELVHKSILDMLSHNKTMNIVLNKELDNLTKNVTVIDFKSGTQEFIKANVYPMQRFNSQTFQPYQTFNSLAIKKIWLANESIEKILNEEKQKVWLEEQRSIEDMRKSQESVLSYDNQQPIISPEKVFKITKEFKNSQDKSINKFSTVFYKVIEQENITSELQQELQDQKVDSGEQIDENKPQYQYVPQQSFIKDIRHNNEDKCIQIAEIVLKAYKGETFEKEELHKFAFLLEQDEMYRILFVQCFSQFRIQSKKEYSEQAYSNMISLLEVLLTNCQANFDSLIINKIIVLSLSYHKIVEEQIPQKPLTVENQQQQPQEGQQQQQQQQEEQQVEESQQKQFVKKKIFLQEGLVKHPIWKMFDFWETAVFENIIDQLYLQQEYSYQNSESLSQTIQREKSIIFAQISFQIENMLIFHHPINQTKQLIDKVTKVFSLAKDNVQTIYDRIKEYELKHNRDSGALEQMKQAAISFLGL